MADPRHFDGIFEGGIAPERTKLEQDNHTTQRDCYAEITVIHLGVYCMVTIFGVYCIVSI